VEVLNGPGWIDSDRYDIAAKTRDKATAAEILGPLLRTLLEDRFKLKTHLESRVTAVYELSVLQENSNLRPAKAGDCAPIDLFSDPSPVPACGSIRGGSREGKVSLDWYGTTMAEFAGGIIQSLVVRPVVDKTGLSGRFDFHLEFVPEKPRGPVLLNGQDTQLPPNSDDSAQPPGPSIFGALQKQLGLKLSPGKAALDVIVIDNVERPADN
jgi:uncharacterized protein (TIGR03435 family)